MLKSVRSFLVCFLEQKRSLSLSFTFRQNERARSGQSAGREKNKRTDGEAILKGFVGKKGELARKKETEKYFGKTLVWNVVKDSSVLLPSPV